MVAGCLRSDRLRAVSVWLSTLWFVVPSAYALEIQQITDQVYALVGDLGNRSSDNLANNATFGVIITSAGVVLIDSGGSHAGAEVIAKAIASISDKPVTTVINSGGQDHRWLGNDYFKRRGAQIIASEAAVEDQMARLNAQFLRLSGLLEPSILDATKPVSADIRFDREYRFSSGETEIEIYHAGQAHTPGDSYIWLPAQKVLFSGDIVYSERLLGIMDHSNSASWIDVFEQMAELQPEFVVPGHGHVTDLARAKADSYDYLVSLRHKVGEFYEAGKDISEIGTIDQSAFAYLLNFDTLAGRNAQQVYIELEWE